MRYEKTAAELTAITSHHKANMNLDDEATNTEELQRNIALSKRKPMLPKVGACYNCESILPMTDTFCDFDCQHDYLRRTENMKGKE